MIIASVRFGEECTLRVLFWFLQIWDLENKNVLDDIHPDQPVKSGIPWCTSLNWSYDGRTLFIGTTSGNIHVYEVAEG